MAFCPHCGANVHDGFRFCPDCGGEMPQPKSVSTTQMMKNIQAELDRQLGLEFGTADTTAARKAPAPKAPERRMPEPAPPERRRTFRTGRDDEVFAGWQAKNERPEEPLSRGWEEMLERQATKEREKARIRELALEREKEKEQERIRELEREKERARQREREKAKERERERQRQRERQAAQESGPDISGLYGDTMALKTLRERERTRQARQTVNEPEEPEDAVFEEEELDEVEGSPLLRGLILIVAGLLIVATIFAGLLFFHVLDDWLPTPEPEPPAATLPPVPDPVPENVPAPEPEPEPTPEPEPEPEPTPEEETTAQMLDRVLHEYYTGYLKACNQQDVTNLVHSSQVNNNEAAVRISSSFNSSNLFAEDDYTLTIDPDSIQALDENNALVNVKLDLPYVPRAGGSVSETTSLQTIWMILGTGEDGWIVNHIEYLSEADYAAHKHAFTPEIPPAAPGVPFNEYVAG